MKATRRCKGEYTLTKDGYEFEASYQYGSKIWLLGTWNTSLNFESRHFKTLREAKATFEYFINELKQG